MKKIINTIKNIDLTKFFLIIVFVIFTLFLINITLIRNSNKDNNSLSNSEIKNIIDTSSVVKDSKTNTTYVILNNVPDNHKDIATDPNVVNEFKKQLNSDNVIIEPSYDSIKNWISNNADIKTYPGDFERKGTGIDAP